jgi:hypothetical protein
MYIKYCMLFILSLLLISCNSGSLKGDADDPYIIATKIMQSNNPAMDKGKNQPNQGILNAWLSNNLYKFTGENCYGGVADSANNSCSYLNNDKKIIVTAAEVKNIDQTYSISTKKSIKLGDYVYLLDNDKNLWLCGFDGACDKANGKYVQMLGVDFQSANCISSKACSNDGEAYRSLLVLPEPQLTKHDSPQASYYTLTGELQQVFVNAAEQSGTKILSIQDRSLYAITRDKIKNDVPITEMPNGEAGLLDLAFVLVSDTKFSIQLIFERYMGKGNVYQMYYGGFEYGASLIKQDTSTNTNIVRRGNLNHLGIFVPLAEKPVFEGTSDYRTMQSDLRVVAGGDLDTGENYDFCKGLNTYCDLGVNVGYSFISGSNYLKDIINNALFFGALGLSAYGAGIVGEKFGLLAEKMLAASHNNRGVAILAKFGGRTMKGLNYVIPVVGVGTTLFTMTAYSLQIQDLYVGLMSEDPKLPLLSATMQDLINLPQNRKTCRVFYHDVICADDQAGGCEKDLFESVIKHEMKLRKNPRVSYAEKNLYNMFINTKSCSATSLNAEQKEMMNMVTVDNLSDFRSSVVGLVYQKLFLESNGSIAKQIDINNDEIDYFESDTTIQDPEQLASDISLRIPNCDKGVCDPTYFADAYGNWIKTKNGKYASTINGNFINMSYSRTDSNFRFPLFERIFNPNFIPPDLTYSIKAYQLSDLKCDEFNTQIKKITGSDVLPAQAAVKAMDPWSLIVDKTGAVCNYNYMSYKNVVKRYDSGVVADVFMLAPLSANPIVLGLMYAINVGLGLFTEFSRLAAIEPENYSIRNGHWNNTEDSIYGCTTMDLKLRSGENVKQISQSKINPDGLWIIGDKGLHYVENGKQKYNFDFNQFGSGVANSYQGKLIISAHGAVPAMKYIDSYDEKKLLALAASKGSAAESYMINIDDYQDGTYGAVNSVGKLYVDSSNHLYGVSSSSPEDRDSISYVWNIVSHDLKGSIKKIGKGGGSYTLNNLAVNSENNVAWIPVEENGLDGFNLEKDGFNAHNWITYKYESGSYNPYLFSIGSHYFVVTDRGQVFGTDFKQSTITRLDRAGIPLYYPLSDAVGSDDGKFYLLSAKHVYSCKMPDKFLDFEYRYDKFKLNIKNHTSNLDTIALVKALPSGVTSNLKYDQYSKEYMLPTPFNATTSLEASGNTGKLNLFISGLRLSAMYSGRKTLADRDYMNIKIHENSQAELSMDGLANKAYFTIDKVSESEFNLNAYSNGDGSNYKLNTDEQGAFYLEANNSDFTLKNYQNSRYTDQYIPLIYKGSRYWIGISKCSGGNLLLAYYNLSTNSNPQVIKNISYIRQTNGRVQSINAFCSS